MKIRLVRSKDVFALVAGDNDPGYKINIVDAAVFARKATLNTTVQVARAGNSKRGRSNIRCVASSARCTRYRKASRHVSYGQQPIPRHPVTISCVVLHRQRRLQRHLQQKPVPRQTERHQITDVVRGRWTSPGQKTPTVFHDRRLRAKLSQPVYRDGEVGSGRRQRPDAG